MDKGEIIQQPLKQQFMLMAAIGFTEEDLQANREGYLTKKQRRELNDDRTLWKIFFALTIPTFLIGTLWVILDGIYFKYTIINRIEMMSLLWVFVLGIGFYIWRKIKKYNLDLHKGDVQAVQGIVQLGEGGNSGVRRYYCYIQGISWSINLFTHASFKAGDPYAIYYAPHSKTLLSTEWLGNK
jgi:hypothetical protein